MVPSCCRSLLLLLSALAGVNAFLAVQPPPQQQQHIISSTTALQGGSSGVATTLEGKKATVATVVDLLDSSELVFTVPANSLTVSEVQGLRGALPEGTTMKVVKNTLMERAVADNDSFACMAPDLMKGPNMWFFCQEDVGGTIKAFNNFVKENGKEETHMITGGCTEGAVYDKKGIDAIGKLPSKQELYAKIAGGIKAVPTKLARIVKANPEKLARAIQMATAEEGGGSE